VYPTQITSACMESRVLIGVPLKRKLEFTIASLLLIRSEDPIDASESVKHAFSEELEGKAHMLSD
jgi:hypothetical protein